MKVSKFNNHFENGKCIIIWKKSLLVTPASEIYNPVLGAITNEDFSLKSSSF